MTSGIKPTICPLVVQWDSSKPLFQGSARNCPHGPHIRDVLCPFGFWGYRYAIEQLSRVDQPAFTIPAAPNCEFVVGETQTGVDLNKLTTHVKTLRETLTKALPNAQLREGKDRASIEALLGNDLPFVYFYCHGERVHIADPNTWLAVGERETITAADFIGWTLIWSDTQKKRIWDEVRPLVFINACHSLAIEPETLVSYLEAFVGTGHASGVIGTEVKINQDLAMDVAEGFFASWLDDGHTVESALRAVRMDLLRQGNLVGLVYTPYCWSELQVKKQ